MKVIIFTLSIFILCLDAFALEKPCTKAEAMEAESSITHLNNWKDIYLSFKRFRHCDDGAIAEGYSDVIVRQLAFSWDQVDELIQLLSADRDFFVFVLHHIDATADEFAIKKLICNSSELCPDAASSMCSAIAEAARKALREIKGATPAPSSPSR